MASISSTAKNSGLVVKFISCFYEWAFTSPHFLFFLTSSFQKSLLFQFGKQQKYHISCVFLCFLVDALTKSCVFKEKRHRLCSRDEWFLKCYFKWSDLCFFLWPMIGQEKNSHRLTLKDRPEPYLDKYCSENLNSKQ